MTNGLGEHRRDQPQHFEWCYAYVNWLSIDCCFVGRYFFTDRRQNAKFCYLAKQQTYRQCQYSATVTAHLFSSLGSGSVFPIYFLHRDLNQPTSSEINQHYKHLLKAKICENQIQRQECVLKVFYEWMNCIPMKQWECCNWIKNNGLILNDWFNCHW